MGFGRRGTRIIQDASLDPFVLEHIEPGTTVITDGWQGYADIENQGYRRDRRSQRAVRLAGGDPHGLLPGVQRIGSLTKRWLDRRHHQGSVDETRLQTYLDDEFVFRFSRR